MGVWSWFQMEKNETELLFTGSHGLVMFKEVVLGDV